MLTVNTIKKKVALLDVKASGLMPMAFPVEVAWIVFEQKPDGVFQETLSSYTIKPDIGWREIFWDDEAEKLHGYSYSFLKKNGHPLQSVAAHLLHYMPTRQVLADNVPHTERWLDMLHHVAGRPRTYTVEPIGSLLDQMGLTDRQAQAIFHQVRMKSSPTRRATEGVKALRDVVRLSLITAGIK